MVATKTNHPIPRKGSVKHQVADEMKKNGPLKEDVPIELMAASDEDNDHTKSVQLRGGGKTDQN